MTIGDLVFISTWGRKRYSHSELNPHDEIGTVVYVDSDYMQVKWIARVNSYSRLQLHTAKVLQEEVIDGMKAGKVPFDPTDYEVFHEER